MKDRPVEKTMQDASKGYKQKRLKDFRESPAFHDLPIKASCIHVTWDATCKKAGKTEKNPNLRQMTKNT